MLVDSHCHLDYLAGEEDLDAVVERARAAGVGTMLTIGTRLDRFPEVAAIAERYADVWCTVGVHPHEAGEEGQAGPERLLELTEHAKVVGIGESGLDYHYDNAPRPAQRDSFRAHVRAARDSGLPLVVHAREADDDVAAILREGREEGPFACVMHCFSSGRALARQALELGFSISFSGIVTFKAADELRGIAREVPIERLLVETDAPYLAPVPKRGRRNEPAYLAHTAAVLAELKGLPAEELARATSDNFFRLFGKAKRPEAV